MKSNPLAGLQPTFRPVATQPVAKLEPLAVEGAPALDLTCEQYLGVKNEFLDPSALQTVSGKFGRLSEQQFENLHHSFGGRSQVGYDSGRHYTPEDFLPPALQALLGQDLQLPEAITLPGTSQLEMCQLHGNDARVDLTFNCHAAAWEAMQAYQQDARSLEVFLAEMITLDDLCQTSMFVKVDRDQLQPGDLVQFHERAEFARMTMLLHSAVYVGNGLFFEKPNTESEGEDSPCRLATWEMLEKPVSTYSEGRFEVKCYRPQEKLPEAREAFESPSEPEFKKWAEARGESLDTELVICLEQGMGGGIRAEHASALVEMPLYLGPDGRGRLSEVPASQPSPA